jgi:hypothetical protein
MPNEARLRTTAIPTFGRGRRGARSFGHVNVAKLTARIL